MNNLRFIMIVLMLVTSDATTAFGQGAGYIAGHDTAVAILAAKEAEANLLRGQLAYWEKIQKEASAAADQTRAAISRAPLPMPPPGPALTAYIEALGILGRHSARVEMAGQQIAAINAGLQQLQTGIATARAYLTRLNQTTGQPNQPFRANNDPRANEPPGGIRLGGSDYVPISAPDDRPGLTTTLPGWAAASQQPSGGSGPQTTQPTPPGGPGMTPGNNWQLPPIRLPGDIPSLWPPYLNPWPAGGGGSGGHTHTPGGKDVPAGGGGGGHKHGPGGKDIP